MLSVYHAPTVHHDILACQVVGFEEQETDGAGDVGRIAGALEGRTLEDGPARAFRRLLRLRPQDDPGRHTVDADLGSELLGEGAGEADQRRLADGIGEVAEQRTLGVNVGDVDDGPPSPAQFLGPGLGEEEGGVQVDAFHFLPMAQLHLGKGTGSIEGGVVDDAVEAAEDGDAFVHEAARAVRLEQVGAQELHPPPQGPQFPGEDFGVILGVPIMQGDVAARCRQVAGDLCTHAARGAGDENTFGVFGQKEPMRDPSPGFVTHRPDGRKLDLPEPDPLAAEHSASLRAHVVARIAAAGGSISFADFMEAALYTPGLGYYMAGQRRFGPGGDFFTAPEMGPVLATVLAHRLQDYSSLADGILEFGGGSGALARQLRAMLPSLPYAFLERSGDLAAQQAQALPEAPILQGLPEAWRGVLLAHEVLDALPFLAVEWDGTQFWERRVGLEDDGNFRWTLAPLAREYATALRPYAEHWPSPYRTEIRPLAEAWLKAAAACLTEGAILLIDYGDESTALYHPQRQSGSLRAYYRHRVLDDPFFWPGLCDLTADVDFGALRRVASRLGLRERWYGPLARFLVEGGLAELYPQLAASRDARGLLDLHNEIKRLTLPQEMGERFKVLLLEKAPR